MKVAGKVLDIESSVKGAVYVYDLAGKIVASQQVSEGTTSISLENVANGVYVVKGPQGKAQKVLVK